MLRGKVWLWLSVVLALAYTGYVIWAKFAKTFGVPVPVKLGEVGEFLMFFAVIAAFTMQIITAERTAQAQQPKHDHPAI